MTLEIDDRVVEGKAGKAEYRIRNETIPGREGKSIRWAGDKGRSGDHVMAR